MLFSFGHHQLRRLVHRIVGTVPVDYDAVDAAAHHVCDLALHLIRVGRAVADIHVLRPAKPKKQVRIDFRCCSRIEQRMDIDFADVACASIAVRLTREVVGGACVVGGLSCESGGRYHVKRNSQRTDWTHLESGLLKRTVFDASVLRSGVVPRILLGLVGQWGRKARPRL